MMKYFYSRFLFMLILGAITQASWGQSQGECPNALFEQGDFTNWFGETGVCCPATMTSSGIVPGRHTIIATPSPPAPNACGMIDVVPPSGSSFFARVGDLTNASTPSDAECLSYSFDMSMNRVIIASFAGYLNSPTPAHGIALQPKFSMSITDSLGVPIGGACTQYSAIPAFNQAGWQNCGTDLVRNWTTVAVTPPLSYKGMATVTFCTEDCGLGAHWAYAYVTANCMPAVTMSSFCAGASIKDICAPAGFDSYQWASGATTRCITINNPQDGQRDTVTVTSSLGCSEELVYELDESTGLPVDFQISVGCFGDTTHFTDAFPNDTSGVTWQWDFGDGNTSNEQNPSHLYASPGTYDVEMIKQAGTCSDTITKPVTINPPPTANFSIVTNPVCPMDSAFFIDQSSGNGDSIILREWSMGDGTTYLGDTIFHQYDTAGNYTITLKVQTEHVCTDVTSNTITVIPKPTADFTVPDACLDDSSRFNDTSIPSGWGVSIVDWKWDFGDGNSGTGANPSHLYSDTSAYRVLLTITDANGCTDTASNNAVVHPLPALTTTATDVTCYGSKDGEAAASVSNGTSPYSIDWGTSPPQSGNMAQGLGAGTYAVTVTDANGCIGKTSVTVEQPDNPPLVLTLEEADTLFIQGEDTMLHAFATGGTPGYTFNWLPEVGLGDAAIADPTAKTPRGIITYTVTVTDADSCTTEKQVVLIGKGDDPRIYFPNAFSPNDDGINDVFLPNGLFEEIDEYNLEIWNRWGAKLFVSESPHKGWDGTYGGKPSPQGTYLYLATATDKRGEVHEFMGYVFLLR